MYRDGGDCGNPSSDHQLPLCLHWKWDTQKLIYFKLGRFLAVLFFSTKTVNTAKMLRLKASKIKSPLRSSLPILVLVFSHGKFRRVAVVCRSCYWYSYQGHLNCVSRKTHCRDGFNAMCWEMSAPFIIFFFLLRWHSGNTELAILKCMIHWRFVCSQCCTSITSV